MTVRRNVRDVVSHCRRRAVQADLLALHIEVSGGGLDQAEQRFGALRRPGTHQPVEPQNFPPADGKGQILHRVSIGQSLHPKHLAANGGLLLGIEIPDLPADHLGHDLLRGGGVHPGAEGCHPVPEDGDVIADLKDLVEPVGDVDDGRPPFLQPPDGGKQVLYLALRKGGGGLVHDEDLRVGGQGLDNFHHLLVLNSQVLHRLQHREGAAD